MINGASGLVVYIGL